MRFHCTPRGAGRLGILAAALLLSACSLAGDVTPPPGVPTLAPAGTPEPTPPPSVEALLPEAQPAALEGGVLYQERCAPCHGPTGSGGGSLSGQLPEPPPDFSDPTTLRSQTPQELYLVVTIGRVEQFMPPFGATTTAAERWNAVAYLHTLSAPQDQIEAGQTVYEANCANCHGALGQADGLAADGPAASPDLSDPAYWAAHSPLSYFEAVSDSSGPHAGAAALSETERWAAVDYARSLAYAYSPPEAVLAEGEGTVLGQLVNGTAGAPAPGGLTVSLYAFDEERLAATLTTTAAADGGFAFDGVAFGPGRQFVARAEYQGVEYSTLPASFRAGAAAGSDVPRLEMQLPVYETTRDPAALAVSQAHMFLEFGEAETVTVGELFVFSNSGDRAFAATVDEPLAISLPAGATGVNVQGGRAGETFLTSERGLRTVVTVPPGEATSQLLYSYRLPYGGGLQFAQPMDFAVGEFNLLVADLGVSVMGAGLQDLGQQQFQGEVFQNFSRRGLSAGDTLAFEVAGRPGRSPAGPAGRAEAGELAVGLGALAAVLLGIGLYLFRRAPGPGGPRSREALLQALADLDDAYAAQRVEPGAYRRKRDALKAALKQQWE